MAVRSKSFHSTAATDHVLSVMAQYAQQHRRAMILYHKPDETQPTWRIVEPYDFVAVEDCEVSAIRCFQIYPEPEDTPWRSFRLDRIFGIEDGRQNFTPRRWMSIETGEITPFNVPRKRREKLSTASVVVAARPRHRRVFWVLLGIAIAIIAAVILLIAAVSTNT
jgi:predicted DNA-binding transcriptional regulator YafY